MPYLVRFFLLALVALVSGCGHLAKEFEVGTESSSRYELVYESADVLVREKATEVSWILPVRTGKLSYPIFSKSRFTVDGSRLLIPIELSLDCIGRSNLVTDSSGRTKCFVLSSIDLVGRREDSREEVPAADVRRFGWIP